MPDDFAYPELLARIGQLEDETARLQLLIAELLLKNQQLRRDIRAAGVPGCSWTGCGKTRFFEGGLQAVGE